MNKAFLRNLKGPAQDRRETDEEAAPARPRSPAIEAARQPARARGADRYEEEYGAERPFRQREPAHDGDQDEIDPSAVSELLASRELPDARGARAAAAPHGAPDVDDPEDGFGGVEDRLGRIEARIAMQPGASSTRPIRKALARLESRLDKLSQEDRGPEFEEALTSLDRRLDDIAQRLERDAAPRRDRPARRGLGEAIEKIAERQRILDEESARQDDPYERRPATPPAMQAEGGSSDAPAAAARLGASERAAVGRAEVASRDVAERFDGLRRELEKIPAQKLSVESAPRQYQSVDAAVAEMAGHIADMRGRLRDGADGQRVVMLQIEALRREMEGWSRDGQGVDRRQFERVSGALDQLLREVETMRDDARERDERQLDLMRQMEALRLDFAKLPEPTTLREAERVDRLGLSVEKMIRQLEASQEAQRERSEQQILVMRQLESLRRDVDAIASADRHLSPRVDRLQDSLIDLSRQLETMRDDAAARAQEQAEAIRDIADQRQEHPARLSELCGSVESIGRRLDSSLRQGAERAEQSVALTRQVDGLRIEIESLSRALSELAPRASINAIETALRDLGRRVDLQRERGASDASLAPVERIAAELRDAIRELDPSPIVRNLHADVETIGRRLEELSAPGAAPAPQLAELAEETHEVRDLLATLVSRPLPLEKIETRLVDLTQRVEGLGRAGLSNPSKDIGDAVDSIRSIVVGESSRNLQAFNQRLEALSRKLDDALAKSGGKRFEELSERIEQMHKSLAQRIERSAAATKPADTGALETLVSKLAKKIDAALEHKPASPSVDELGRKIEKLETRLHDPASAASIARIESLLAKPAQDRHFSELAQRIDSVRDAIERRRDEAAGAAPQDGSVDRLVERLDERLGERIDAMLAPDAKRLALEPLEQQLEKVSAKLDRLASAPRPALSPDPAPLAAKQLKEIADRIDFLHGELAARIEDGASRGVKSEAQLKDLVDGLASRMNAALDPKADASALQSVERQIQLLSQRLDRTDGGAAALGAIERRIGDLFTRIEESRDLATQAAEIAVRRATQDMLREAAASPSALTSLVEEELSDIRRAQDDASERAHETLSAVHETLERVVERLALFEEELSELRHSASPAALHAAHPEMRRAAPASPPPAPTREDHDREPQLDAPVGETVNEDLTNFLLEPPGARHEEKRRKRGRPPLSQEAAGSERAPADFIAAARRAAQQAAADADAAELARRSRRAEQEVEGASGKSAVNGGGFLGARKRPLLLALGAVVLLAGAYQVVRIGVKSDGGGAHLSHSDAGAENEKTALQAPQGAPPAPVETPASEADAPAPTSKKTADAPASRPVEGAAPSMEASPPPRTQPAPGSRAAVDSNPTGAISPTTAGSALDGIASIKALAAQGDVGAQYELGSRFIEGRGGAPRDVKLAVSWLEKAAQQGLAPAQYRLGSMYEKGVGVERSYGQARRYYQQAAEAGNARSMHNLAVLAAEGDDGKPDYEAAARWFQKAAELGVRDSQYNLAILYARGLGVQQNLVNSYLWFAVAADQGDADAGKKRDEVAERLDAKSLAQAKAAVANFRPAQPNYLANEAPAPHVKDGARPPSKPETRSGKSKVSRL